jgi:hypothetical protein
MPIDVQIRNVPLVGDVTAQLRQLTSMVIPCRTPSSSHPYTCGKMDALGFVDFPVYSLSPRHFNSLYKYCLTPFEILSLREKQFLFSLRHME